MIVGEDTKPQLDDNLLAHYGIKGMKWGVRRGSRTTGMTRGQGAVIDRNNRQLKSLRELKKGNSGKYVSGTKTVKTINVINNITMGRSFTRRYYNNQIASLTAQNKRVKSGKMTLKDRLDVAMQSPASRLISVRPG